MKPALRGGKVRGSKLLLLAVAGLLLLAALILATLQSADRQTLAPASDNLARQSAATIYLSNAGPDEQAFLACVEQSATHSPSPLVRWEFGPPPTSIASSGNLLDRLRAGIFSRFFRAPTAEEIGEKFKACMNYCNQQQVDCGTRGYVWCGLAAGTVLRIGANPVGKSLSRCIVGTAIADFSDFPDGCPGWYRDNVCGPQYWRCQNKCREKYKRQQDDLILKMDLDELRRWRRGRP